MGNRHNAIIKTNITIKIVLVNDSSLFFILTSYHIPRSPALLAMLFAMIKNTTQTSDWKSPIAAESENWLDLIPSR